MRYITYLFKFAVLLAFCGLLGHAWAAGINNSSFELDAADQTPPLTGWNLDFYTVNDFGTRGTGPATVREIKISTARSFSGTKSVYSSLQNINSGPSEADSRKATHYLITASSFSTNSNTLYLWRSDVSYTTSSRWYWRLDVVLSDGTNTNTIELACRAWGSSEGCTANYQNTSDLQATGSDGQTWYRHPIAIPIEMDRTQLTMIIRHQQDSWDGTTAQSSLYFDLETESAYTKIANNGTDLADSVAALGTGPTLSLIHISEPTRPY